MTPQEILRAAAALVERDWTEGEFWHDFRDCTPEVVASALRRAADSLDECPADHVCLRCCPGPRDDGAEEETTNG